jgi:hypothetical protein
MRGFLLLFFGLSVLLHGEQSMLLETQIKIIPKIMALNTKIATKTSKAILGVVYDNGFQSKANDIVRAINTLYGGKIGRVSFEAVAVSVEELSQERKIDFVYMSSVSDESAKRCASWGASMRVPVFAYDVSDLENGVLGSISIERNTVVYISKSVLKAAQFEFNDSFYQIARLIE